MRFLFIKLKLPLTDISRLLSLLMPKGGGIGWRIARCDDLGERFYSSYYCGQITEESV